MPNSDPGGLPLGLLALGAPEEADAEVANAKVAIIEEVDTGVVVTEETDAEVANVEEANAEVANTDLVIAEEANAEVVDAEEADAEVAVPEVWAPSPRGSPGLLLPSGALHRWSPCSCPLLGGCSHSRPSPEAQLLGSARGPFLGLGAPSPHGACQEAHCYYSPWGPDGPWPLALW